MIIPESLSPFPVLPSSEDLERVPRIEPDGFVSDSTIQRILVGPMAVATPDRLEASEGFPAQIDLPFVALSSDEAFADEASHPSATHDRDLVEPPSAVAKGQADDLDAPSQPHPALADPQQQAPLSFRLESSRPSPGWLASRPWALLLSSLALFAIAAASAVFSLSPDGGISSDGERLGETRGLPFPEGGPSDAKGSLAISQPEYPAP